ncbi:hypothetical protein [Gemmatimonas sp. UBA7669]|uniref:hypothetical protein n=1 Tax=Gemmatimonas sp. UBA7669 TaxID=1946568 RepID=UPI0025C084D9|nr:hypothetical protein [Gemmatimonas sp. UBA7669]
MKIHKNAYFTPLARYEVVTRVEAGQSQGTIAAALGVWREAVNMWYRRVLQAAEPAQAAPDRSSRLQTSTTRMRRPSPI